MMVMMMLMMIMEKRYAGSDAERERGKLRNNSSHEEKPL